MARKATSIELTEEEKKVLLSWIRAGKTEKRYIEGYYYFSLCRREGDQGYGKTT